MKICLFFISFLIFSSCDLPNEAESDCSGIHLGSAFIDDCGRCVGENTGFQSGHDKDLCGQCFGSNECLDGLCVDQAAINFHTELTDNAIADNSLCVYDICETIPSDTEYLCNTNQISYPYQTGDQLNCADVEESLNICFPSNCNESIKLSDFYGKVIWLELTSTW